MSEHILLPESNPKIANFWFWFFLFAGFALRLFRYAQAQPIWGDEAQVGLNIIHRGYGALLQPLDYRQVAPLGFLWSEHLAYQWWGMSEYAMRFFPLLAGLLGFFIFARWTRLLAKPVVAALATGVMAVGVYSVRYAVELKPYSYDLLAAMVLLWPATAYLLHGRSRALVALIVVTPLAMFISYPAVFTAGGIGVALVVGFRKNARWFTAILIFIFGVVLVATFLLLQKIASIGQYQHTADFMTNYWSKAFPPANPWRFIVWLADVHTGNMFAYPGGGNNGASTASFLLALAGLFAWLKLRRGPLTWLLLAPFLLTFFAAALHRYPYGTSARVAQHLAPAIVLFIGLGTLALVQRFWPREAQQGTVFNVLWGLLILTGLAVLVRHVVHPYQTPLDEEARKTVRNFFKLTSANETIAVWQPRETVQSNFQWYLCEHNERIIWNAAADWQWQHNPRTTWVVNTDEVPGLRAKLIEIFGGAPIRQDIQVLRPRHQYDPPLRWEDFAFPPGASPFIPVTRPAIPAPPATLLPDIQK